EIAVGLKRPHRSSDGGVALGYGYDSSGQLEVGTCNTTVWISGSNLRDGSDEDRVARGGERFVSGLQGVDKSTGDPINASQPLTGSGALQGVVDYFFGGSEVAPWESWFVTSDGATSEARKIGHSGDVSVYAPCQSVAQVDDPEIDVPVLPPEIPEEPPEIPHGTPVVKIDKVCAPGAIGGLISCTISVTNTGSETPAWPIIFSDVSTILSGPGVGGVTNITSATPDGADWFCTPTPTADFACALPGFSLPPGISRNVTVQLNTADLVAAGNFGFKNCASLAWPHFGIACDEGGADLKFEKTGPQVGVASGDATYTLTITNTGDSAFTGKVMLTDQLFISGAPAALPIVGINPDPLCDGGLPGNLPMSCVTQLTLAAGASTSFDMTVTLPADPAGVGYWAHNCFTVTDPLFGPLPGPPGPGAGQSCMWTEVLPVEVASNLKIEKTALNGGKCQKAGGDVIECDYEIEITNEGEVPFSDFVSLDETVPEKATLTSGDPGWVCGGPAPNYKCNSGGSVDLIKGASTSFPVKISMPLPDLEANGCKVTNRVKITAPAGGSQSNFKITDDEAEASADAFLQWWVGGMLFITCDPTNIKTEKIAKGPCTKIGNLWRCIYDVTLTNLGPDPLTSAIKLKETFSATPEALTFDAAWNCSGGGVNYECEYPVTNLQKGDTLKFSVTAEVPERGLCSLKNTASLVFPIAGTRGNSDGSDDTASAVAKIPSRKCTKPLPEVDPIYPIVDPEPTCPNGRARRSDGSCPCPRGETWNRKIGKCEPKQCFDPERRKPNGKCCPRDTIWNQYQGTCTPSCPEGQHWNPRKQRCVTPQTCPQGSHWDNKQRRCVPDQPCDRYSRWSWSRLKCVPLTCKQIEKRGLPLPERCQDHAQCGTNEELRGDRCVCKSGYLRIDGACVRKKMCRTRNAHYDYDLGRCVCNKGYRWYKRRCVPDVGIDPPPPPPPQCRGKNEEPNRYGKCVCKSGYTRILKKCVRITLPPPERLCPDGKPVPKSGKCPCGSGKIWNAKTWSCETRPPTACRANDAKCFCKLRGGKWRRGRCIMPETAQEKCRKAGGTWKNNSCQFGLSAKDKCLKKGGTWKKGRCRPKPSVKLLCTLAGKEWKNGKCRPKVKTFPIKPGRPIKKAPILKLPKSGTQIMKPKSQNLKFKRLPKTMALGAKRTNRKRARTQQK
ncbi:MAG: DUF11 domain-containing protein, partial [Alphaproteobacteria bacterium]|nr:DUF11 domain-containing protein [Alphaproteobacteria bacterium]